MWPFAASMGINHRFPRKAVWPVPSDTLWGINHRFPRKARGDNPESSPVGKGSSRNLVMSAVPPNVPATSDCGWHISVGGTVHGRNVTVYYKML